MRIPLIIILSIIMGCAGSRKATVDVHQQIKETQLAIKLDPTNPVHYIELGNKYYLIKDLESAKETYDKALELKPGLNEALFQKGNVLWQQQDYHESVGLFKSVLFSTEAEAFTKRIGNVIGLPHPVLMKSDGLGDNAFPACSPLDGKILFQSNRDGNWDIYLTYINNDKFERLTQHDSRDESPVFAPDGESFAFTSTRDDSSHIHIENMNRNIYIGTINKPNVKKVTQSEHDDWSPVFSPTGNKLLFLSGLIDENGISHSSQDIFELDLLNGERYQLSTSGKVKTLGDYGTDHTRVYFSSNPDDISRIYYQDSGKQNQTLAFDFDGESFGPKISPLGDQLVFFGKVNDNFDIYLAQLQTQVITRLTCDPAMDTHPTFSFDGKRIYFQSNRDGSYQIYCIDLNETVAKEELIKRLNVLKN